MINHQDKYIFIHIGKTGGTSIERALNPDVRLDPSKRTKNTGNTLFPSKHMTINGILRGDLGLLRADLWDLYFKFTFVRNPWDREVSSWKWRALAREKNKNVSFKEHIQRSISPSQSSCICKNGQYLTDFIGRFENLQEDFDIVCDKIGIPRQELPHYNKTKHKHYTEYYHDEARQIVAEKYAKDIEYFGYKFGE